MHSSEEQKKMVAALGEIYDNIQFHGIYAKYTRSVSILASVLNLDDAAELHYVMMHLSRLSYLKSTNGSYLWASSRYMELINCDDAASLVGHREHFLEDFAEDEISRMEENAHLFNVISTNLISSYLKGRGDFTCHAKIYPVYNQQGKTVGSLAVLAELASNTEHMGFRLTSEEVSESALLI